MQESSKKAIGKTILILIVATLVTQHVNAEDVKLDIRWRKTIKSGSAVFETGNVDADPEMEVLTTDSQNKLRIYDVNGTLENTINLPPTTKEGRVHKIKIVDFDKNGEKEILLGFGGMREVVNHTWDEYYNLQNESVGRHTRFLYRSTSETGILTLINMTGDIIWNKKIPLSINDIEVVDYDRNGENEILVATGSFLVEEWWENTGYDDDKKEVWDLVEYNIWNTTLLALDKEGNTNWTFSMMGDKPNKIRSVVANDFKGGSEVEIVIGSDNNYIYILNTSGGINATYNASAPIYFAEFADISQTKRDDLILGVGDNTIHALDSELNLLWKYKLPDIAQDLYAVDIEGDEKDDIFIAGRDSYIYLFHDTGSLRWKHFVGEPVYHIKVDDLDLDLIHEIIIASDENITVFNLNKRYIKEEMGNVFYGKAYDQYRVGDYILARIYAQRARELYLQSEEVNNLPRIDYLLNQIMDGISINKKNEADYNYGKALELYGRDRYEESELYLKKAKTIYVELKDSGGADKVDLLMRQIRDEIKLRKSLKADGLYADALSYYGFRNFTNARNLAEDAKRIYDEIEDSENSLKINGFVIQIGDEYFTSARRSLVGIDYENARDLAGKADEIYMTYNHSTGIEKVDQLEKEIKDKSERKASPFFSQVSKILPYLLVILIIALVYNFIVKKKEPEIAHKEKSVSASLEKELEEMI